MEAKQGYTSGMDQDTSLNKRNPASYLEARNFRVLTFEGLSTGSLETEKGHTLAFTLPDLPTQTLTDGTIIPPQSNLKFVGATTMVDKLILFSTSETSTTPNGYGQIWVIEFDEATDSISGLVGNNLNPAVHLKYNNKVNFSTEYRIKAVARYETNNIQRVYWTDFYNAVRVLNIANPDSLDTPVASLDLRPGVNFSQPNVISVGTGNLPTGCVVQPAYKLLDSSGAESLVSPLGVLTPLPEVSYDDTDYEGFLGNGSATVKNKSITYTISNIDPNYNVIEHLLVVTDPTGVKTVYKFGEDNIPTSGEITVICDDIDEATTISLTEFNMLSSGFDKAKDIEVRNRRLIAANTLTANFDLDIDTRAYRFNSTPEARLEGNTTIILPGGINPNYDSIPTEHDAINIYNQEDHPTWFSPASQYKYQKDGVTLGGSGKYVSYNFTTELLPAYYNKDTRTTTYPHLDMQNSNVTDAPLDLGTTEADGTPRLIQKGTQYKNYASSWAHGNLAGYARGETYRFGVVFYNKKGSVSFVKWIGDIRFPDVEDGYPIQTTVGNVNYLVALGIEFNVDFSSISSEISGYSIVRLKREDNDCTKLGSGMLMYFDIQTNSSKHSLMHRWEDTGPNNTATSATNPYELTDDINVNSVISNSHFHLSDKPGFNNPQLSNAGSKRLCYLLSPLGQMYGVDLKANDFISTRGYYSSRVTLYGGDYGNATENDRDYAFYYKLDTFVSNPYSRERFEIDRLVNAEVGEYFLSTNAFLNGYAGTNNLVNASYARDKILGVETANTNVPLGMGSKKLLLALGLGTTLVHSTGDPGDAAGNAGSMRWYGNSWTGPDNGATSLDFAGGFITNSNVYFKEVVYARYLASQYGGNTYAQRSLNQYISTGHFQNTTTSASQTFKVFGGDTFVTYYDDEQIQQYWGGANFKDTYKSESKNKLGVAVCFPAESRANTHFRNGQHWAANRDGANMSQYESNSYNFPAIWQTENEVVEKFFAKDFLLNLSEEHPHQLWASENKIDGELIDNWRIFKTANATEVDGVHGPINRILSFNNNLLFYQDKAFGIASIDERVSVQDTTGQELVLGKGGVFPTYTYISTTTGCLHQYGVIPTTTGVYHYDGRLKKIFKFSGGAENLSDLKGMSSFLHKETTGEINSVDKTLRDGYPIGVHGTVDNRYNGVLFTFLGNKPAKPISDYYNSTSNEYVFPDNTYVTQDGVTYYVPNNFIIPDDGHVQLSIYDEDIFPYSNSFTLAYDELTQNFEALYDYVPGLYIDYGRRLLSASPLLKNEMYTHYTGVTASFYGRSPVTSKLRTILAQGGDATKIFNNLEYQSQLTDTNGNDIYDETVSRITVKNEYQTTGVHDLVVGDNIKRRMRTWRYVIPRDANEELSRIRNPWVELVVEYDNNADKRLVLHEIQYSFTPSRM